MTKSDPEAAPVGSVDAVELLPSRLVALAKALAREIDEPYRAQYGLPMKDWLVMRTLAVHGAMPPTEIHRVNGQNRAQITRALKCLLDRYLVAKEPHPEDSRTFLVSLTETGVAMYADIVDQMRRRQDEILATLSANDSERLKRLIDKLEAIVSQ